MNRAEKLILISHHLCPYVQRAAIALSEKDVVFERVDIDLSNKPQWFLELSPLGKTPVLKTGEHGIFESSVILEYLEETQPGPLHPPTPLARADQRAWMEFGSAILNDVAGFYRAADATAFAEKTDALSRKFARLEQRLGDGPYFAGADFSLVDATFGPVFRYFDVFERISCFGILEDKPRTAAWRRALASRPSVKSAVAGDYEIRLWRFLQQRASYLSDLMKSPT